MNVEQTRKLRTLKRLPLEQLRAVDVDLAAEVDKVLRRFAAQLQIQSLDVREDVRDTLSRIDFGEAENELPEVLRRLLADLQLTEQDIESILKRLPSPPPAPVKGSVGSLPGVAQQLSKAQVQDVVAVAKLPEVAAAALARAAAAPSAISDLSLGQLVDSKELSTEQAQSVGLATSVYRLSGENADIAAAICNSPFPKLGNKAPASILQLAELVAADWSAFLTDNKVALPAGTTAVELGAALAGRFAAIYPAQAFIGRIPAIDPKQLLDDITALRPLLQKYQKAVGASMSQLSEGLAGADLAPLVEAHLRLTQLANTYPGLQLIAVLDDDKLMPQEKADTTVRRIGYVSKVSAALGQTSLFQLNLATDSPDLAKLGLAGLGAEPDEQQMVLKTLQAYQRIWTVAKDSDRALSLMRIGFASAVSIGRFSLSAFQAASGLADDVALPVWERARSSLADVGLTGGSIIDVIHGVNGRFAGNQSPSALSYLKQLAGFQDLFGNLSLCNCQECQSILGPAAYFVDLMKFIDENLRVQFKAPGHPLDLKTRRPDLWTLELSCDNTNNRIALLDIVNPVLENFIALRLGYGGPLDDRDAIGEFVYQQTLATSADSFAQPFTLPLARLASYMTQFSKTRSDVAVALGAAAAFPQAELGLSVGDVTLITTSNQTLADLSHVYGVAFQGASGAVEQVDASILDAAMDLSRDQLGQLIATWFVAAGGAALNVLSTKRDAASVQNDVEWVQGLTVDALDRMHRFTRLLDRTGWAISDQDLVLQTLNDAVISPSGLQSVAQIHAIVRRLSITVQDGVALIGPLPQTPAGQSLFDTLFNTPAYLVAGGAYPQPLTRFIHPAFRQNTPAPIDPNLPRLMSGLSVNLGDLAALARHLAPYLAQENPASGFDPNAASENDRYFVLSAPNLTLLYRHARLARVLGLAIEDFFELIGFVPLDHLAGLADLEAVLDLHDWFRQGEYRVDDIAVATGQKPRNPAAYPDPLTVAAGIVTQAATGLTFTNTIFAVALGTTEQGSADLVVANATLIEALPNNAYRLVAGIDLSTAAIIIPPSGTVPTPPAGTRLVTEIEVRSALQPYLATELLVRGVGKTFNIARDKVLALAALSGQSLTAEALVKAVRGDGPVAPLTQFVTALLPLSVVFADPLWDATALAFVGAHAAVFGTGPLPSLAPDARHPNAPFVTVAQLRALSVFARIAARQTGTPPNTAPVDRADIEAVLLAFDPALPGFPPSSDAAMARVLNVPSGLVVGLRGAVTLPAVAAAALDQLDAAVQLAQTLGLDGNSFAAIVSGDYGALSNAADALTAVLRSRITDPTTLSGILEQLEQPIRSAKRDALVDYLIHSITPQIWTTSKELFEYFLIDVDAGGCETSSLVVAATMSAQLYVYRALMNLEQDDRPPNDPAHFVLTVPPEAALEWEWRKNYRVWQANREVFLWPENYMIPDLRDDKTPLFEDIEQELLQTSLTDQDVLDAYAKYLAGLNEVANLTIAGAYHDSTPGSIEQMRTVGGISDVLHLFGCTADDPPVYYYRTCQNLLAGKSDVTIGPIWGPWTKVTVQITGRRVAPVVHNGRLHVFWNDIKTKPNNQVTNGSSNFVGYQHLMTVYFTTLQPNGTWTPPQKLRLPPGDGTLSDPSSFPGPTFGPARGEVLDPWYIFPKLDALKIRASGPAPVDDYTLSGPNWDGIWPWSWSVGEQTGLEITYRNFNEWRQVDLFAKTVFDLADPTTTDPPHPYPQMLCAKRAFTQSGALDTTIDNMPLYWGVPTWMLTSAAAYANLVIDDMRILIFNNETGWLWSMMTPGLYVNQIATIPTTTQLLAVPGAVQDGILQVGGDVLLLQAPAPHNAQYVLTRIGTTLVDTIARKLFEDGVDAVLDTQTQLALAEAQVPITIVGGGIKNNSNTGQLDFKGAYGTYYREVFMYLPWLIGNSLNALGSFEAAHNWYRYIFDPTASERIDVKGLPPDEAAHRVLDRVWRYREFRGLDLVTLRHILTDPVAISLYKREPFNPFAIARRRTSAFQKAIVMAMVSNLFDWADSLFTQFTMESVNEAMMLYIMASDILGPRPVPLGDCGAGIQPDTYANIGPLIDSTSDVLIELETWTIGWRTSNISVPASHMLYALDNNTIHDVVVRYPERAAAPAVAEAAAAARPSMFTGLDWQQVRTAGWAPALANRAVKTNDPMGGRTFNRLANKGSFAAWVGGFSTGIIQELTPAFCVPTNANLLGYWDRLDDRLYKIRHCQDINGNLRRLALFAPPINPLQLVAMTAAGLSLDDVLGATNGDLPPYRFTTLIERAKSFASTLSGFGSSLVSALEKKDAEQLNRLRLTQQMNLAQLTTQMRQAEIDAASATLDSLNAQLASAQYRSSYYDGLITESRSAGEYLQSATTHAASGHMAVQATLGILAASLSLIPQVGSPFAMKYGGVELGGYASRFADSVGCAVAIAEAVGSSAGLEARFGRRTEGWKNLKQLADDDVAVLNKQIVAATIRLNIANDSMTLHQTEIDQIQDLLDFADTRFTNYGLYTWLAAQLQSLYRRAYQNALGLAMLAQQAYRFERGDDTLPGLSLAYWDPTNAGLLAGERLLIDLQSLESRYLETNYRTLEIDQPFALSQIDPGALLTLRETGHCTFTIPEVFFDLFYPGHYKRRIKTVRLTIPSITGPYVNVGATLELLGSFVRTTTDPSDKSQPLPVAPTRTVTIATSTAQNDAGVFELSFRDERYMPFEGLGAVSQWQLTLPQVFRQFDYETINDVILSISYTAQQDGVLRQVVEGQLASIKSTITTALSDPNNPAQRLFSLRQDFSSAFTRLLRSPVGTQVTIELSDRNFPMFVRGRALTPQKAVLILRAAPGANLTGFTLTVDGTVLGAAPNAFTPASPPSASNPNPTYGGLPYVVLPAFALTLPGTHTFVVSASAPANLAPTSPAPADVSAIDPAKLHDVFLYVEYTLS